MKARTVEYFEEVGRHLPTESCCFMEVLTEILRKLEQIEHKMPADLNM